MTDQETLTKLRKLHREFEDNSTTDARRCEIVETVQAFAEADPFYAVRCIFCKKAVVHIPYAFAYIEGHIYSNDGVKEFQNSRICEYCFDKTADKIEEEGWAVAWLEGGWAPTEPQE